MFKKIKKFPQFLKEVKMELKRVSWSKKEELLYATVLVLIASSVLTFYIAMVDLGFSKVLQFLLK